MDMYNRINYCVLIVLFIAFSTQSCVNIEKQNKHMKLESKIGKPAILRLCNYGDLQVDFYKQSEKLTSGHLFINDGEEYGYYVIKYNTVQGHNSLCLQAKLYIFDSQGGLIKEYENAGYLKHIAVPHCGYNSQKKIVQKYSSLYEGIFEVAIYEASEINNALKKAGPINDKSEDVAGANIQSFFKDSGGAYKKHAGFHKNKVPQPQNNLPPQKQEKKPLKVSDFNHGLEIGRYYCVQDENLSIQMLFGIFTLQDGNRSIAVGNYKSYGNKLVVSFYEGEFKGQTFTYIVDDSKHFHHSVDEENWVHESVHKN